MDGPEHPVGKNLSTDRQSHTYLPIADWLFNYKKAWLRPDLIAGLTAAAVVIPKAMAYATIAGLPVQVGLYTVLVPMAIYSVLGTSRPLSVSTTTTIAVLTAAQLSQVLPGGDPSSFLRASAMLTLVVGGFLLLASLLRLGFIADFISEPVLVGFKAGIGVVIVLDQVPKILGIHFPRGSFFHYVVAIARGIHRSFIDDLSCGDRDDRNIGRDRAILSAGAGPVDRRGSGNPGCALPGTACARTRVSRSDSSRPTLPYCSEFLAGGGALARSPGYRSHEFYRDDCCRPSIR